VVVGEDDPGTPAAAHLSNIEQPEAFSNAVVKFLGRVA